MIEDFSRLLSEYIDISKRVESSSGLYNLINVRLPQQLEDAIRNAVSQGDDADTLAAITGSLAEAYYGIPMSLNAQVEPYVYDDELIEYIEAFNKVHPVTFTSDVFYDDPLIFTRK